MAEPRMRLRQKGQQFPTSDCEYWNLFSHIRCRVAAFSLSSVVHYHAIFNHPISPPSKPSLFTSDESPSTSSTSPPTSPPSHPSTLTTAGPKTKAYINPLHPPKHHQQPSPSLPQFHTFIILLLHLSLSTIHHGPPRPTGPPQAQAQRNH